LSRGNFIVGLIFTDTVERMKRATGIKNDSELARKLNITPQALSNFKKKGEIPTDLVVKFAVKFKLSVDYLLTGEERGYSVEEKPLMVCEEAETYGEFVYIPIVSGKISAGGGLIPETAVELKLAFKRDWIQRHGDPRNMSLIRVSGDSMEPVLYSGDIVLVDHNRNYIDPQGGIYAIAMDDQIMIKRLQVIYPSKKVRIISDNPKYEPLEAETEQVIINGKVIWFGREIER